MSGGDPVLPVVMLLWVTAALAGGDGTSKDSYDPYQLPNGCFSKNFGLFWGDELAPDPAQVDLLLDGLERAWTVQIEEWGHAPPLDTEWSVFRVYLGDSGDGAPATNGASHHNGALNQIVLLPGVLDDAPVEAKAVVAHEFFHAVQSAHGRFDDPERDGAWYFEATANWAAAGTLEEPWAAPAAQVYAESGSHLPLDYFDPPNGSTDVASVHQYGAYLFPLDLSVQFPGLVSDSWKDEGPEGLPMDVLRRLVADQGIDFDAFWFDHIARVAALELPARPELFAVFDDQVPKSESWIGAPEGPQRPNEPPHGYGFNLVHIESVQGPASVHLDLDPGDWGAHVVVFEDAAPGPNTPYEILDVPIEGGEGFLDIPGNGSMSLTLALGVAGGDGRVDYTYEIVDTPRSTKECGCATPRHSDAWWLLLLVGAALRRADTFRERSEEGVDAE